MLEHHAAQYPCDEVAVVLVAHLLPPLTPFLRAVTPQVDVRCVLGIPYSNLPEIEREVSPLVELALPDTLEQLAVDAVLRVEESLRDAALPTVLVEVGGYCAPEIARLAASGSFRGAVEHTMQGHWQYLQAEPLPCPVLSIAASKLKALENAQVGRSLSYTLEHVVRRRFHRKLSDMRVGVLGYGGIGAPAAHYLSRLDADVRVYDRLASRRAKAHLDGFPTPSKADLLAECDVVIGVTGQRSLTVADVELMKDGAILASGSSKQVEIDVASLLDRARVEREDEEARELRLDGKTLWLLRDGMPINFHSENVLGPVVDLIYTELYMCLQAVSRGDRPPGLRELDADRQEAIAEVWCETYAEA